MHSFAETQGRRRGPARADPILKRMHGWVAGERQARRRSPSARSARRDHPSRQSVTNNGDHSLPRRAPPVVECDARCLRALAPARGSSPNRTFTSARPSPWVSCRATKKNRRGAAYRCRNTCRSQVFDVDHPVSARRRVAVRGRYLSANTVRAEARGQRKSPSFVNCAGFPSASARCRVSLRGPRTKWPPAAVAKNTESFVATNLGKPITMDMIEMSWLYLRLQLTFCFRTSAPMPVDTEHL